MKATIQSVNVAITLTYKQFEIGFMGFENDDNYDFLQKACPDCEEINYDGHFGPYIFFTARKDKFRKAKKQMIKAIKAWLATK